MNKAIAVLIFLLIISISGNSQDISFYKNCKVISIDTTQTLPGYLTIKITSNKGQLLILSEQKDQNQESDIIQVNKNYNFLLEELDSVFINNQDSSYYYNFLNLRGVRGSTLYYDGDSTLRFEDFNFKPYKARNLYGLEYNAVEEER